jgi:endonuclease/exonuclease/phosphatase (EEP) superfamily protein YafD
MQLLYSTSKALDKWLKAELPTLEGTQKGRNFITTDAGTFSWQLHIIDNSYKSSEKTIIATEAYSRFTCFIPAPMPLTLTELHHQLSMQWQQLLVEIVLANQLLPNSDAILLLSKLEQLHFDVHWVKNTDLSINGHITDAAQWVTHTLKQQKINALSFTLSQDLAMYINEQDKFIKQRKEKFIPIERFLDYCQRITDNPTEEHQKATVLPKKIVSLSDYKKKNNM